MSADHGHVPAFISENSRRLSRRDGIAHVFTPLEIFCFCRGARILHPIPPAYTRGHTCFPRSDDVSDDDLHVPQRRARMRFISPQTAVTAAAGQNSGDPMCRTHLLRFMNFRRRNKHVPVCLCVEVVGFRQRINELFAV